MDATGPQMACMEVWGGSQLADHATSFGGLDLWVYSRPHGQATRGGDVVYASSCATGRITRLIWVADVAGHGHAVAATAADLRLLMRRLVNCLDHTELLRHLNRQFAALSTQAAFATAVVATYFAPTRRLTLCNAGHPRPLLYRAAEREWRFLGNHDATAAGPRNLPLGILDMADYDASDVELQDGDCLLAYTDVLMESQDADGEMLGEAGVLRILQLLGEVDASRLITTLLCEIGERYPDNLAADDLTVMVVRATGRQAHYPLADRFRALGRVLRTAAGSLRPGAERAPLPDASLANVAGAIVPALQRRWHARGR